MEQNKKILISIFTILVLGVFVYIFNQGKKVEPVEGLTSTWESFEYNDKDFSYPPSWQIEEIMSEENKREVMLVRLFKNDKDGNLIEVFVGGDKSCDELEKKLCLGKKPVYTDSADAEAMQLFSMFVRINENPQ